MFCISNDCSPLGDIPCVISTCMKDLTGELRPQTGIGGSLIQHCVCIPQASTYIAIWYTTTHNNKTTYIMTAYYTTNDSFAANNPLFH